MPLAFVAICTPVIARSNFAASFVAAASTPTPTAAPVSAILVPNFCCASFTAARRLWYRVIAS